MNHKARHKIAMIAPSYPCNEERITGGVEGVTYYLVNALTLRQEVDVEVIVPAFDQKEVASKTYDGITVHSIPIPLQIGGIGWANASGITSKYLWAWIKQQAYDLIHIQGATTWARHSSLPTVVTIHGIGEQDLLYRGVSFAKPIRAFILKVSEGMFRKKLPNIIAINPYVKQYLQPGKQHIWDISNPIADSFFKVEGESAPNTILCASSIIERKNITGLIKAFHLVQKNVPNVELAVAGAFLNEEYKRKCCVLIDQLNLSGKVRFLGSISVSQLQKELAKTRCFALCSFQETAPLSISEAMAVGVPVIASNICGMPWMIENEKTGFLVTPYSTEEIARSIERVLSLKNKDWISMSTKASKKAEKNYRASIVAKKTVAVYSQIINRNRT